MAELPIQTEPQFLGVTSPAERYADIVTELLTTGSVTGNPYSNSLLQLDGYADNLEPAASYSPEFAVIHDALPLFTQTDLDLGVEEFVATLRFTDEQASGIEAESDGGEQVKRYTLDSLYPQLLDAGVEPRANARHSLGDAGYHLDAARLALETGLTPSALISEVCQVLEIPLSVTVTLRKEDSETNSHSDRLATIYYPLISSPQIALDGVKNAVRGRLANDQK